MTRTDHRRYTCKKYTLSLLKHMFGIMPRVAPPDPVPVSGRGGRALNAHATYLLVQVPAITRHVLLNLFRKMLHKLIHLLAFGIEDFVCNIRGL